MSRTMPRVGTLLMAALLLASGFVRAGELSRPVPSDAPVTRFTRFNISYSLRDIVADGVQKVEFYISDDMGRTWRLYGEDPDRMSPMTVEVPGEGVYGFVCIATDRFGNRERAPVARTRPETVIVVDRTSPTAKWLAPTQDILGRGQTVELSWESADANFGNSPVKIQYAFDARSNHDRDAVWNTLQENLSAKGSINWTPPTENSGRYNFRLVAEDRAGNMAVAYNAATVVVDSQPPMITGIAPLRSNKLENDLHITADDGPGGSGVKEISLYTSGNGAGTWTLLKENAENGESVPLKRKPGEAVAFTAPGSGEYALWPVVFDEAGNASPLPSVGVPGPFVLVVDTEPPSVTLSDSFLMGRAAVLANETRRVEWTAYDPHILNNSAIIHLSLDNGSTWQELRSGLPASGSDIVNFPFGSQSEDAKIKVTVSDEFGNLGETVSATFKLSSASTTVVDVTPVAPTPIGGGSSTSGGSGWMPFDETDGGPPPLIPPPPGTSTTQTVIPAPVPPAQPPVDSFISPQPPAPLNNLQGGGSWGAPIGAPPIQPDYAPPDAAAIRGESSASSIPNAMLSGGRTGTSPGLQLPTQPQPATPPPGDWAPSPDAGRPTVPTQPPTQTPSWNLPPASQPSSDPLSDLSTPPSTVSPSTSPMPDIATSPSLTPPTSVSPLPPPVSGSSPSSGFEGLGEAIAPPPLPTPGAAPSGPASDGQGLSGLTIPGGSDGAPIGGSFTAPMPPPLPQTSEGTSMRPPSGDLTPPPSAESTSQSSSLPQPMPTPGPADLIAPPGPIQEGGQATRPTNPRDLSNHYISESKAYQEEGRMPEAMESATKAINSDDKNPVAFMQLSQINARSVPPNYVRAATLAKAATELSQDWDVWLNCAEVYHIWSHAKNREVQAAIRSGQTPPVQLVDERNQTLANARVAIDNAALRGQGGDEASRKKIANMRGLITYLGAMTVPEPVRPAEAAGPAVDQYRRDMQAYKSTVSPMLTDALPFFQEAMRLDGSPAYSETFHLGMINYRLGNMERDTGNASQATMYYQEAARFLEEATTSKDVPLEGPREAYYMLAHCHDQISQQPGANASRHKELALRYWQQTVDRYPTGSQYRSFAEQRINALTQEMGL